MKFSNLTITANAADYTFQPYDRGANGAFVWRLAGTSVHAPRVVVSTTSNDAASDKSAVQLNTPRVCPAADSCDVEKILGTDLIKTEMRFLASTSQTDRNLQISQHIALLQEMRSTIESREVVYS